MYSLLSLLGDFDRHSWLDFLLTVSRYETTGSDFCNSDLLCVHICAYLSYSPRTLRGMQA